MSRLTGFFVIQEKNVKDK